MKKIKKIKYCTKNFKNDLKPVYKAMKERYPHIKHKKTGCLGECKTCKHECFVMVKSGAICAKSPDQLYKQLKQLIG
ncbi:DUF1450 domain-containing protein [Paenibacillus sp. GCM10023252]|uniref:DUF1450 domain-containing protein n=1 Tax=Paenibacillus sp. GCM10023252 TaxID=3252649 RepID=UPI00361567EE